MDLLSFVLGLCVSGLVIGLAAAWEESLYKKATTKAIINNIKTRKTFKNGK